MKKKFLLVGLAAISTACASLSGGTVNTKVEPAQVPLVDVDYVMCRKVPVDNYCDGALAKLTITPNPNPDGWTPRVQVSDANGYFWVPGIPATWTEVDIELTAPGYKPIALHTTLAKLIDENAAGRHNMQPLEADHVDPSTFSLPELAAVRGAMWGTRINVPYGPRPDRDDNLLALTFYDLYDAPTRTRMLDRYHDDRGYTHGVTGPASGNDCYHYLWPCFQGIPSQAQWDAYLDSLQEQWDRHVIPCYFAKGDGEENNDAYLDAMDALHLQPRAQRLIKCVVYPGWEPSGSKYGWHNSTYVRLLARGARVFPTAFRVLHLVADLDAPIGDDTDPLAHDPNGKTKSWLNVTPYIHGLFVQVGGYVDDTSHPIPTPTFLTEFAKLWADYKHRFENEWHGQTAWPDNQPIRIIYAEGASFGMTWRNWPESVSLDLGDLAMQSGADGYLDGGRVPVPVR